jgi:hypothetical protein
MEHHISDVQIVEIPPALYDRVHNSTLDFKDIVKGKGKVVSVLN